MTLVETIPIASWTHGGWPAPDYSVQAWLSATGDLRHLRSCHYLNGYGRLLAAGSTRSLWMRCSPCAQVLRNYVRWPQGYSVARIFYAEGGLHDETTPYALEVVEAVIRGRVAYEAWERSLTDAS